MHGRCGAGAARCAPTRRGLAALGYVIGLLGLTGRLLEWRPDALMFACGLVSARGSASADLSSSCGPLPCGRGSVFVPAGYQPLGVAGQRVVCSY